jgi:hypothetical protein
MANTGAIRAGRAFVELFADDSKLVRGLRRAEKKLKAFGDSVRGFGLKMAKRITGLLSVRNGGGSDLCASALSRAIPCVGRATR